MALTSRQLKDALVSWCMEAWKASGRLVTLEQAVQKMVEVKLDSQEGVDEEEPDMRPVMLGPEEGRYLEVTLDDNPSASGKLLERRQMLDRFIRDHPEILAEIDPLLDADILGFSWVDPRMADQLESMDRDVKIRLLAKYRLLKDGGVDNDSTEDGANNEPEAENEPVATNNPVVKNDPEA